MKRILCFASAALFLFAVTGWSQQTAIVRAGAESGKFTVTRGAAAAVIAADVSMDSALAKIRETSYGEPVSIQFGVKDTVLNIGDTYVTFTRSDNDEIPWGAITLSGSVASTSWGSVSIYNYSYDTTVTFEIKSTLNISTKTAGGMNIGGSGPVEAVIAGGKIVTESARGSPLSVSGKNVRVKITGGEFEAKGGASALYMWDSYVSISDTSVKFISAPNEDPEGSKNATVEVYGYSNNGGVLELAGGTVANKDTNELAVRLNNQTVALVFTGAAPAKVEGGIASKFPGAIKADASFKPGSSKYKLVPNGAACADGVVAVKGGGSNLAAFTFVNEFYQLEKKDDDIIVKLKAGVTQPKYIVTGDTTAGFTAVAAPDTVGKNSASLSILLDSILVHAKGRPCGIQFGNGTAVLNVGGAYLYFGSNNTGSWGRVSLTGKLAFTGYGSLSIGEGVSIENTADISGGGMPWSNVVSVGQGADFTHKSGTVKGSIYNGGGTLTISGGSVGDTLSRAYAVENGSKGEVIISGTANIVSADTSSNGGTIKNQGTLVISGGKVSNVFNGSNSRAVLNGVYTADTTASAIITGTAEIYAKNPSSSNGVVFNNRGAMRISGGKIRDGRADSSNVLVLNRAVMTISDSADIASNAVNQWSAVTSSYSSSSEGESAADSALTIPLQITGGKIDGKNRLAVFTGSGIVSISGTAKLTSAYPDGVVGANSSGHIYLLGGDVTSTAKDTAKSVRAVNAYISGQTGPGKLTMGGAPVISGGIIYVSTYPVNIMVTGASKFAPGDKKYTIGGSSGEYTNYNDNNTTYPILLKNGAGAVGSFVLDSAYYAESSPKPQLAVSGNEGVLTITGVWNVSFSLNGGTGTVPAVIQVVRGGVLGELARPSTTQYYITKEDGKKYKNDDKWYIQKGELGGEEIVGEAYIFDKSVNVGTPITEGKILTLKWTNELAPVSVLASNREIPAAPGPAAVVTIAPVTVTAGELTAGPNPSALQAGKIGFFWNGAALKSGKLTIFNAAGSPVGKITVVDNAAAGKRQVASWNLKDAKGRLVSDGAYVAKGVITTKSGKTEKASLILGVR